MLEVVGFQKTAEFQGERITALRKNLCKIKNCDKNLMMEWLKN